MSMTLAEWRFSAKMAWQDTFIRWVTVLSALSTVTASTYMLWKLIPEGIRAGVLTLHYTIYLGIDDVRTWPWVFVIPGTMLVIFLTNSAIAFGLYRTDRVASRALVGLAAAVVLVGCISSFFLILINE